MWGPPRRVDDHRFGVHDWIPHQCPSSEVADRTAPGRPSGPAAPRSSAYRRTRRHGVGQPPMPSCSHAAQCPQGCGRVTASVPLQRLCPRAMQSVSFRGIPAHARACRCTVVHWGIRGSFRKKAGNVRVLAIPSSAEVVGRFPGSVACGHGLYIRLRSSAFPETQRRARDRTAGNASGPPPCPYAGSPG